VTAGRRRAVLLGAAAVGVYLLALAGTVALRADHVRPLYDGFAPQPTYRWVEPPPFFASGNVKPTALTTTIKIGSDGSEPTGIATPDGQFVLNLGRDAIAPKGGATKIKVKITPVAPSGLQPVPSPLRSNGNAYEVEMTYDNGGRVGRLAKPGSLVMEIPELGTTLYSSGSGTGTVAKWSEVAARPVPPRQLSLAATFEQPGVYLGATNLPQLVAPAGESSNHAVVIGIAVAVVTALLLVIAFVLVRRRRRRP
jgi:hypothetical protein